MKKSKGKGEIVQDQGGHILRSTCRKDRHSKVYTSKGPRDRRVRLSANTAIQFYDVQDRLGYDRPSKAVDWLLKKAKHAIDMLAELPPWNTNPDTSTVSNAPAELGQGQNSSSGYPFLQHRQMFENTSFLNQTVGAQFVDDNTMKSFFPESRDLCLSLQTLQEMNSSHNYSRMVGWDGGSGGDGRVGSIFSNSESMTMGQPPTFCSMVSQRGPLQSSYTDLLRALDDRSLPSSHHHNQHAVHESSVSGSRFVSYFQVPARIHGQEEFMVVASDPITTSTSSLHSGH